MKMLEENSRTIRENTGILLEASYDGWINFENETQDRQEWRNAICEREGKDRGFSYDLLHGARTTFRGMVLRDQPGEYCRRNGRTYYEHEDKSPLLFPPHSTLEPGPWMGGVKPDQASRIVPQLQRFKRKLKARERT
ncbi:hypothetical protein ANN_14912 [Periplaneta americana]|uniref:Uncharacterized protein n=1 Tax=Periplaneta americana TaxID=6978 RepID=A0ABQ8SXL4_PERAM|nr:hypothetical protein ANN_14912 [Periplaneta americana]